jgi:hypothetical protein
MMTTSYKFKESISNEMSLPIFHHQFEVSGETQWIYFEVEISRSCWFNMLVFDPLGVPRLQYMVGKSPKGILLHQKEHYSSTATLPGPLPSGEWTIELYVTDMAVTDTLKKELHYHIICETGNKELPTKDEGIVPFGVKKWAEYNAGGLELNLYNFDEVMEKEARWYKGDFHTHTILSDGSMTQEGNLKMAKQQNLDFFVATDHNIVSTSWAEGTALVIPGVEITSTKGHWNALGVKKWMDYRRSREDGGLETEQGMNHLFKEARESGALCSMNHPFLAPWDWQMGHTSLSSLDSIEIWNDPTFQANTKATEKALLFWTHIWNEGYTITGIGGSDSHLLPEESYEPNGSPSLIGDPGTYVWSECLTASAILRNVKKGHVYVSRGPELDFSAQIGKSTHRIGENLTEVMDENGYEANCQIKLEFKHDNVMVQWIENGIKVHEEKGLTSTYSVNWSDMLYHWLRVEVRTLDGELLAFTNPIYYGSKQPEVQTWVELLKKARRLGFED